MATNNFGLTRLICVVRVDFALKVKTYFRIFDSKQEFYGSEKNKIEMTLQRIWQSQLEKSKLMKVTDENFSLKCNKFSCDFKFE